MEASAPAASWTKVTALPAFSTASTLSEPFNSKMTERVASSGRESHVRRGAQGVLVWDELRLDAVVGNVEAGAARGLLRLRRGCCRQAEQ